MIAAGMAGTIVNPLSTNALRADEKPTDRPAHSREFHFTYAGTVTGLAPDAEARIWLPVPPSDEDQQSRIARIELPSAGSFAREPKFGNEILYFEGRPNAKGEVSFSITYRVTRFEVQSDRRRTKVAPEEISLFLRPDLKVPITGKPQTLLQEKKLPTDDLGVARTLYEIVNDHMTYSKKGTGWGQGDAVWACDSRYGNCSDFHSLFISLARSRKIPAKFEIGFPLPEARGTGDIPGYHCWAKFKPEGRGWIPVDISEANKVKDKQPEVVAYYFGNLTENRLTFSVGRDLDLVPRQAGPPLNFMIYPYVEVAGKPLPADQVVRKFSFEDVNVK